MEDWCGHIGRVFREGRREDALARREWDGEG